MAALLSIGLVVMLIALVASRPRIPRPIVIAVPEVYEHRQWGCGSVVFVGFIVLLVLGLIAS